jgi:hypothetical protein
MLLDYAKTLRPQQSDGIPYKTHLQVGGEYFVSTRRSQRDGIEESADSANSYIRQSLKRSLWEDDKNRVKEMRDLSFYSCYENFQADSPMCAKYLNLGMSWGDKILLAQCRLLSDYVFYRKDVFTFIPEANCPCCNLGQLDHKDGIWHMIRDCNIQCGELRSYAINNVPNDKFLYRVFDKQCKTDYDWTIRELLALLKRRNLSLDR